MKESKLICRAAMMEFEINMSEMPLGKLSKTNIQKGMYRGTSCNLLYIFRYVNQFYKCVKNTTMDFCLYLIPRFSLSQNIICFSFKIKKWQYIKIRENGASNTLLISQYTTFSLLISI